MIAGALAVMVNGIETVCFVALQFWVRVLRWTGEITRLFQTRSSFAKMPPKQQQPRRKSSSKRHKSRSRSGRRKRSNSGVRFRKPHPMRKQAQNRVKMATGASAGKEISAVLNAMTLNYESPVVRYSDTYTDTSVACVKPFSSNALNFANARATTQSAVEAAGYPPASQLVVHTFRDPLRATVTYNPNVGPSGNSDYLKYSYSAQFAIQNASTNLVLTDTFPVLFTDPANGIVGAVDEPMQVGPVYWTDNAAPYAPHGPVHYCGKCAGRVGTWIDAYKPAAYTGDLEPTYLRINLYPGAVLAAPLDVKICVYRCLGERFAPETTLKITMASGTTPTVGTLHEWIVERPGYYAFDIVASTNPTTLGMKMLFTGNSPCYEHRAITRIEDFKTLISQARVTAVSSLISFAGANIVNGGMSVSLQSRGDVPWITLNSFQEVASKPEKREVQWKKGLYGYLKPTQERDFFLKPVFVSEKGIVMSAYYEIVSPHNFITQVVTIPTPNENINSGFGRIRSCHTIEFPVDSAWIETEKPLIEPKAYESIIAQLRHCDQFFENPDHIKALEAFVRMVLPRLIAANPTMAAMVHYGGKIYKSALAARNAWD